VVSAVKSIVVDIGLKRWIVAAMSRPKTSKRTNKGINFPPELYGRIVKHSEKTGVPIARIARRAIEAALAK
jgi:hypothetical protein